MMGMGCDFVCTSFRGGAMRGARIEGSLIHYIPPNAGGREIEKTTITMRMEGNTLARDIRVRYICVGYLCFGLAVGYSHLDIFLKLGVDQH